MSKQRIQKALGTAGVASRRAIEEMVLEHRIKVNGRVVTKLPCFVDTDEDTVSVDGRSVHFARGRGEKVYFLANKPRGVVCTQRDPSGRPRAVDMLPGESRRVYPVGRLDVETTGLLILTNDGDLTEYLTHPRYGVVKAYVAEVDGRIEGKDVEALKRGVYIDGKRTGGAAVKVLKRNPKRSLVEIRIAEGRNREVRRILARLGYKVRRLKRTAIGPVTDRGLKIGSVRRLTDMEVKRLSRCGKAKGAGDGKAKAKGKRTTPAPTRRRATPARTKSARAPRRRR